MKKKSSFLMSVLILLGALSQLPSQATTLKANRSAAANNEPLPDLVIKSFGVLDDPKSGKFLIRIWNIGNAPAGVSYVVLKLYHKSSKDDAKPKEMSFHAKVPTLKPGATADVTIETKLNVTWDQQCTMADGTNQVKESNETNNKWCGLATDIYNNPAQP